MCYPVCLVSPVIDRLHEKLHCNRVTAPMAHMVVPVSSSVALGHTSAVAMVAVVEGGLVHW